MDWQIAVTVSAAVATFVGLSLQVRHGRRVQRQEIKAELQTMIGALQSRIERYEDRHDQELQVVHDRITELRKNAEARLQAIDQIKGELKAQGNTVRMIHEHLLRQATVK